MTAQFEPEEKGVARKLSHLSDADNSGNTHDQ